MGLADLMLRREPTADQSPALAESDVATTAIDAFEHALGGRQALADELLAAPDHSDAVRRVLELIYDPRFAQEPLAKLCAKGGLLPGEFFQAFRDAAVAKANLLVMRNISHAADAVSADLIQKAITHHKTCPICDGSAVVLTYPRRTLKNPKPEPKEQPCAFCRGKGTVVVESELKAQETVLELLGMLKRGSGGVTVTQQQLNVQKDNAPAAPVQGGLADLHKAMSGLRPAPPPVVDTPIEAEVLPEGSV